VNPNELTAWIQVAQVLAGIGIQVADKIKALIHTAQPTLSDAELDAAYAAILADDNVRAAFADKASQA